MNWNQIFIFEVSMQAEKIWFWNKIFHIFHVLDTFSVTKCFHKIASLCQYFMFKNHFLLKLILYWLKIKYLSLKCQCKQIKFDFELKFFIFFMYSLLFLWLSVFHKIASLCQYFMFKNHFLLKLILYWLEIENISLKC